MRRGVCLLAIGCALWISLAAAASNPTVLVFYSKTCEDCERMMPLLNDLAREYPSVGFRFIEASEPDAPLMWSLSSKYGVMPSHFPVVFVGDKAVVGASRANELAIRVAVEACAQSPCASPLDAAPSASLPWLAILALGLAAIVLLAVLLL